MTDPKEPTRKLLSEDLLSVPIPELSGSDQGSLFQTSFSETGLPRLVVPDPKNLPSDPVDRYVIIDQIGSGGFGQVFKALDRTLRRYVAIKVINGASPNVSTSIHEAVIQAKLEHQGIAPIYDCGRTPEQWTEYGIMANQLFVVMKLVEGETLHRLLTLEKEKKSKSLFQLLEIFSDICGAVAFAHDHGVIHRDLKPGNIMIENDTGRVFILDLGLAKIIGFADPLGKETIAGTPTYMSPEQISGKEIDQRTDIYALGAILYEILTGSPPFHLAENDEFESWKKKVIQEEPPLLFQIVPLDLRIIVAKALAKNPDQRYQSVSELLKTVKSFRSGELAKERAEEKVAEARRLQGLLIKLQQQLSKLVIKLAGLRKAVPTWTPLNDRQRIMYLETYVSVMGKVIAAIKADYLAALAQALRDDSTNTDAEKMLADYYQAEFVTAEDDGDKQRMVVFQKLASEHDPSGRLNDFFTGQGFLDLDSDPPMADVKIFRWIERQRRLVPERYPTHPPLTAFCAPLPMGSYLAVISHEGYRPARYPVLITRLHLWRGKVKLYAKEVVNPPSLKSVGLPPDYFVYVPASPFIFGGDKSSLGAGKREVRDIGDFFMARYPVTCEQYLAFLQDILKNDPDATAKHIPTDETGTPLWPLSRKGGCLLLPPFYNALLPVTGICWHDAMAYCRWLSEKTGVAISLPDEYQWEKAAGGVDGRRHPWGNSDEATFANFIDSFPLGQEKLLAINETPKEDASPYGVRGCAGGVRDFTSSPHPNDPSRCITRGGCWQHHYRLAGTVKARTTAVLTDKTSNALGFRICHQPRIETPAYRQAGTER